MPTINALLTLRPLCPRLVTLQLSLLERQPAVVQVMLSGMRPGVIRYSQVPDAGSRPPPRQLLLADTAGHGYAPLTRL